MVLPLLKLGTLLLRTASKPLAGAVKSRAKKHPKFREFISFHVQRYHKWSTNFQRRMYGHDTDVEVRPLDEERAMQAAADMVGEGIVFAVGCSVVVFEYGRSSRSEARKEEARKQELEDLRLRLEALESIPSIKEWQDYMAKASTKTPLGTNESEQKSDSSPKTDSSSKTDKK